jgi:hypothetical protein
VVERQLTVTDWRSLPFFGIVGPVKFILRSFRIDDRETRVSISWNDQVTCDVKSRGTV